MLKKKKKKDSIRARWWTCATPVAEQSWESPRMTALGRRSQSLKLGCSPWSWFQGQWRTAAATGAPRGPQGKCYTPAKSRRKGNRCQGKESAAESRPGARAWRWERNQLKSDRLPYRGGRSRWGLVSRGGFRRSKQAHRGCRAHWGTLRRCLQSPGGWIQRPG